MDRLDAPYDDRVLRRLGIGRGSAPPRRSPTCSTSHRPPCTGRCTVRVFRGSD